MSKSRSISPTTFVRGNFDAANALYREHYEHGSIGVEHFAINPEAATVTAEISTHTAKAKALPRVPAESSAAGHAAVSILDHRREAKDQITKLEKDNVEAAITYLTSPPAQVAAAAAAAACAQAAAPAQTAKTALVDVFKRLDSGIIDTSKSDPYEMIHTVVLYAQGGRYLVIDPNDASFSHILAGADDNIRLCFSKKCKIYKAPSPDVVGRGPQQWRDCIDVAVKLAFSLEVDTKLGMFLKVEEGRGGEIDFASLKDSVLVKEVTNQQEMYKWLPELTSKTSMRLKQTSDVKEVKKVTACLKALPKVVDSITKKIDDLDYYHLKSRFGLEVKKLHDEICVATRYADFDKSFTDFLRSDLVKDSDIVKLLALELTVIDSL